MGISLSHCHSWVAKRNLNSPGVVMIYWPCSLGMLHFLRRPQCLSVKHCLLECASVIFGVYPNTLAHVTKSTRPWWSRAKIVRSGREKGTAISLPLLDTHSCLSMGFWKVDFMVLKSASPLTAANIVFYDFSISESHLWLIFLSVTKDVRNNFLFLAPS